MRAPRGKLKDIAAQHIRLQIANGDLQPGQRIDQDAVAAEIDISRLPVREALIQLESEGLVRIVARRGATVAPLTPDDVLDTYRLYGFASGLATERAARVVTDADLAALEAIAHEMDHETDVRRLEHLNERLHRSINRLGRTHRLGATLRSLSAGLYSGFFYDDEQWVTRARAEHRAILQALRERDAEAARVAMEQHLAAIGEHAVRVLSQRGFWTRAD